MTVDERNLAEVEPEPVQAAEIIGRALPQVRRFCADLVRDGETLGLIGPGELSRIWTRHLVNCALAARFISGKSVADVGSGAGLPGLVLSAMLPETQFTLIEPMERRVDWLRQEIEALELRNAVVFHGRAEEAVAGSFDQVTARAVGAISKLVPIAARLVRSGGDLVLFKGARVAEELAAAQKVISKWKLSDIEIVRTGSEFGTEDTFLFRAKVD